MKKIRVLMIVVVSLFLVPLGADAESIKDLRDEIAAIEKEKAENENKTAEVQARIEAATAKMNEITRQIVEAKKDQEKTKEEITDLEKQIDAKEEEIKDLVSFYQISDSDNFYLKFIFGAESFEDFIYRFSVAEQLTDANDKLVDEMNDLIDENEKKIKELAQQEKKLDKLNEQFAQEIKKLGDKKKDYVEISIDYDDQIESIEKLITYYEEAGCEEDEDFDICTADNVPSDSGFIKPMASGCIWGSDSEYGGRIHPIYGYYKMHAGIDIGGNDTDTPVMAVAAGKVVLAQYWGAAGNAVILNHSVNGNDYHTVYMHLNSLAVSLGDVVTQGQTIGGVGTTGSSTGTHLHLEALYGHYPGYSVSNTFNPRNIIDFPSNGSCW